MEVAHRFWPHAALARRLFDSGVGTDADGAHDLGHIFRVWGNVRRIAEKEGGDMRLLTAATILHDCVAVPKDSPQRGQASRLAAEQAKTLLSGIGWTRPDREAVAHAIHAHSFSAGVAPRTVEARVLQDADRLDALGAVGIARCFYVSGALARALYDPMDPQAERRNLDDTQFALDHFQTKLLQLKDSFQTSTGAQLAEDRHNRLVRFLTDMQDEIAGPPPATGQI